MAKRKLTRREAVEDLQGFGIKGKWVYLIDSIPLIEMMWADGLVQPEELRLLDQFLAKHVDNINQLAGCQVLTMEDARAFCSRFVQERPAPELLKLLRAKVAPVRLQGPVSGANREHRDEIIHWCLDIAASSVTEYPYGARDRFNQAEKACFEEIFDALYPS